VNPLNQIEDILHTCQDQSGAFLSTVHIGGEYRQDANGFVTGLMLRELTELLSPEHPFIARALNFLQRCRYPNPDGSYGFWPVDSVPLWMPTRLAPDADDTAILGLELARACLLSRNQLRELTCYSLLQHRVEEPPMVVPPWLVRGAFYTWLRDGSSNVVDCCVNTNVLALLAYCDLKQAPGYVEAVKMIQRGIEWAGDSPHAARSLAPFYPSLCELKFALRHAVACGAQELTDVLAIVETRQWANSEECSPVCASAYGHTRWFCPSLHRVRWLVRSLPR
jgi:hypothetical protein